MIEIAAVRDDEVPRPACSNAPRRVFDQRLRQTYNVAASAVSGRQTVDIADLRKDLAAVRTSVDSLVKQACPPDVAELPDALVELYLELVRKEVCREITGKLVREMSREVHAGSEKDGQALREKVCERLGGLVTTSGAVGRAPVGRPRIVAMVGPTGVGKTTTIAKLSGDFAMRQGLRVGLITIDTYRIAAVQQLKTIADIVQVPLKTVLTVGELQSALAGFSDRDVVIIDTAGRGQRDALKMNELESFMRAAAADEVHLVLAATGRPANLEKVLGSFRRVGVNRLLLTKLDEAEGVGPVFSLAARSGLPVSYITNGQDIPDDISVAEGRTLARMVVMGTPVGAVAAGAGGTR